MDVQLAERSTELKSWLIDTYGAVEGPKIHKTDAGSPYITFCSGGRKEQGETLPALYASIAAVVADWKKHVSAYAEKHDGKMIVRAWPVLIKLPCLIGNEHGDVYSPCTMYAVRARLVIE